MYLIKILVYMSKRGLGICLDICNVMFVDISVYLIIFEIVLNM